MGRKIVLKLDEVLDKRDMKQKELAELIKEKTGKEFRTATVSELYNNQRQAINREHLAKICDALEIDDISEIMAIVEE